MIKLIELYKQESINMLHSISNDKISRFIDLILDAYQSNNTIFACGNGGNAGLVLNMISDLALHPFVSEDKHVQLQIDKRIHITNLCENTAITTAIGNDIGFEFIFSEQLKFSAKENDLLIGISGSGSSKNILNAFKYAKEHKMKSILITKKADSIIANFADFVFDITGTSKFPGQTGGNDNNFHFEDAIMKITHITSGIIKGIIQNETNRS
jgi:D-sedoheptulose 7-phosphate isomerase